MPTRPYRYALALFSLLILALPLALSQSPPATPADAPLPDLATLIGEVIPHQRAAEAIRKNYIYNTSIRLDQLQKDGSLKKQTTDEYEDFTLEGVAVSRHLQHNGKPLSAEELKKQDEQIDKEVAKARQRRAEADRSGKQTDSHGDEFIPISRMFELGAFTHPRRVQIDGRDTIAVDFTGDPKAKTHNRGEEIIRDMAGTAWIDEHDKAIQHVQGRFIDNSKIAGGLVASIAKGTSFEFTNRKINDEVWLPQSLTAHGHIRILLLFAVDGDFTFAATHYRKFKASSTLLPTFTPINPTPDAPTPSPKPGCRVPHVSLLRHGSPQSLLPKPPTKTQKGTAEAIPFANLVWCILSGRQIDPSGSKPAED